MVIEHLGFLRIRGEAAHERLKVCMKNEATKVFLLSLNGMVTPSSMSPLPFTWVKSDNVE